MNVGRLSTLRPFRLSSERPRDWSRRAFVRTTGGAVATAAALGSGLLRPRLLSAAAPDDPLPIPGGSPALGGGFHVYGRPLTAASIRSTPNPRPSRTSMGW